jgi:soluble lytic murein transglycosylase-like protein
MTWPQLAKAAKQEVRRGGIYSTRWGDASPWLRRLSAELVERAFQPYGTQRWALYIVHRESGENPGAVNRYSGCTGLPQIHPMHRWVNFKRLKADPAYAAKVFVRMSRGGSHTSPWAL